MQRGPWGPWRGAWMRGLWGRRGGCCGSGGCRVQWTSSDTQRTKRYAAHAGPASGTVDQQEDIRTRERKIYGHEKLSKITVDQHPCSSIERADAACAAYRCALRAVLLSVQHREGGARCVTRLFPALSGPFRLWSCASPAPPRPPPRPPPLAAGPGEVCGRRRRITCGLPRRGTGLRRRGTGRGRGPLRV